MKPPKGGQADHGQPMMVLGMKRIQELVALLAVVLLTVPLAAAGPPEAPPVLDLEAAGRIALAANPSLSAAAARVAAAVQRVNQARAAYWPRLDASAGLSRIEMSDNDYQSSLVQLKALNPSASLADPEDYYQGGLTASWTVFDGFARRFALLQARHGQAETASARDDAQRLLLAAVAEAYFGAQLARESVAIAEADAAYNGRLAEEARIRREVGTGSLSDVLNFEVAVNAAQSALIAARQQERSALTALAALLGFSEAGLPEGTVLADLGQATAADLSLPEAGEQLAYALIHRPDLSRWEQAVKGAEAGIGAARAGYWPTVNLAASVDGERANDAHLKEDDFDTRVGMSLTFNLFAGGYHRARVAEAAESRTAATKELERRRLDVSSEIVQALADLSSAVEQLRLQRRNSALVARHRDLVEKEYAVGQASLVRLNEAQRNRVQADGRLAQARVSLHQARFALDAATALTLERFGPAEGTERP